MNAREFYQLGQLKEAIAAATEEVRAKPAEAAPRVFLSELLCFTGDLEKADRQLDVLAHQDPQQAMAVQTFRLLVRGEQARRDLFASGRVPEFLAEPDERLRLHLEATICARQGDLAEASRLLHRAEELRPAVSGACDGKPFQDLRDLDDLTASFFEVLTSDGRYFWVPVERVESAELHPPARPVDLIWRRTHLIVRDGPDGEVFLPVLYPGTFAEADDRVRLGRLTDWRGGDGTPVRGVGQRMFMIDDEARPILELKTVTVNPAEATA